MTRPEALKNLVAADDEALAQLQPNPREPLDRQLLATFDRMSEEELEMVYNRMEEAGAMEPFWEALEQYRAQQQ